MALCGPGAWAEIPSDPLPLRMGFKDGVRPCASPYAALTGLK